ncbi:MAG: NeuD/PglB/VioB family sugar acetyltransferase [Catalinimonas sp.]
MDRIFCIVGAGGFGREVLTCLIDARGWRARDLSGQVVFMIQDQDLHDSEVMGVPVRGLSAFDPAHYEVVVAVGNPAVRRRVVEGLPPETHYATLVHPTAVLSRWVSLGAGTIVTAGVILTCGITVGRHAHLNLHASVGHDCRVGDYFTAAPGARLSGDCRVGDGVYLGTNASVRQGLSIAAGVTVGMGGVVVDDLNQAGVYVGCPARKLPPRSMQPRRFEP